MPKLATYAWMRVAWAALMLSTGCASGALPARARRPAPAVSHNTSVETSVKTTAKETQTTAIPEVALVSTDAKLRQCSPIALQ